MADNLRTDHSDGGQAYPHGNREQGGEYGMSLRDWFAGQFAAQMVTTPDWNLNGRENLATDAYAFADAMIAERRK